MHRRPTAARRSVPASARSARSAGALAPFARVRETLRAELAHGRYPPGARLPSEPELVRRFGVARMTVHRALRELQAAGLVERIQGVGTFAAAGPKLASTLTIRDLHEEIGERGHRHRAGLHLLRAEAAPAAVAARLGLAAGARVFHSLLVHHDNDVPLQCEDRWVNPAAAPGYLEVDFTQTTPTHYLLEVAPAWEAEYSVEAGAPTAREARLLGIRRDTPCLIVTRRSVSRGQPVTFVRLVHPGARYLLQGRVRP
ncbi:MAG: histidine utilization repressor [Gammaproteobacteria bacterium]|nr:histidine utilization repressor [Gammaproteobacteria bacterium]